jgi:hypothetical protein
MNASVPTASAWPPFPVAHLPIELQGLLEDFQWAATPPHPPLTSALLTVVVPCFNPEPQQFSQLLLSLRQQCDQAFHLLLVNDGSSEEAWRPIQAQLEPHSWIQVLHQPANRGISAALNAALEHVESPYVALVDQDDLLHPGAVALVRRHLEAHPDCGLLYSDHLVFDDAGTTCQYIPKFPWNPEVLLEFNFLIHLTVVRADLYRACGGMNSRFDGIQDWEFYLRLAPHLAGHSVGYLPVPLYAWRLSDRSVAASARPKAQLLELAREFLAEAHGRWGAGTHPLQPDGPPSHYRFLVDRATIPGTQPCHLLVLAESAVGPADRAAIQNSVQSVLDGGIPIARLFIALNASAAQPIPELRMQGGLLPEPEWLACSLQQAAEDLPNDAPLLVLQAGVCLTPNPGFRDLAGWLERSDHWDLLTLPGFNQADGRCISAGYSRALASQPVHFPHAQGLTPQAYAADFASYGHTRAVDLPSPSVQLLRRSCLSAALEAFRGSGSLRESWWSQLTLIPWRCCCPADLTVQLPPALAAAEQHHLALLEPEGMVLVQVETWLGVQGQRWEPAYGALLRRVLAQGAGRVHPLHVQALVDGALHPAVRYAAERSSPRFSLLPPPALRPVVMLIPTELNARSNGHACLLTLALQLQAAGHPVHLLPFKPHTFFRHYLHRLPAAYRQLPFIADPMEAPGGVLLAPESAPRQLVRRLRRHYDAVLWWLLAPAGLLTPFRPEIRAGDMLAAFSEFALPCQLRYLFVHPPAEPLLRHLAVQHTPQPPRQLQVALYTGKGRLKPLPRSLHRHLLPYQVVLITRSFPATKKGLLRLLAKSNGLISCDPMTNLSLEAANLGVPTFLSGDPFPPRCYRLFPVDLRPFITNSAGAFIAQLQNRGSRGKLSSSPLYRTGAQAPALVALLTADPEPVGAQAYRVTDQTLQQIELYRQQLVRSRTIQVARDGQSVSSAFSDLYAQSLKAPYAVHVALCHGLGWLDQLGDLLVALRLFQMLRPLLNLMGSLLHAVARRIRW